MPYAWDHPKPASASPRGSDEIEEHLTRVSDAVPAELDDLRHDVERARKEGRAEDELAHLFEIASLSELAGRLDEALDAAQLAAALGEKHDLSDATMAAEFNVAIIQARRGRRSEATAQLKRVRTDGAEHYTGLTALNEAAIFADNPADVLSMLDDAFRFARSADDPELSGNVLNNVATVYARDGRLQEAEQLLQRAALLRQRAGDRRGLGYSYSNLGVLRYHRGDLVGAIPFLEMSVALVANAGDLPALVRALGNNILVFEQHYFERASVLRRWFEAAIEALLPMMPRADADPTVLTARKRDALETEWQVIAGGVLLVSTKMLPA